MSPKFEKRGLNKMDICLVENFNAILSHYKIASFTIAYIEYHSYSKYGTLLAEHII